MSKRSKFSLSHYKLLTCDMGELVPIGLTEVLPGDTIQQVTNLLVRVSPLVAPVMHPVHVRVHHWFVPHRLVWDDWEDFITGGPDGQDASAFPTVAIDGPIVEGTLFDYLGIPPGAHVSALVSALPFRGYSMIWNEFYRDQDLQTELTIDTSDGLDTTTNRILQHSAWEKDYFTSARPWSQKGDDILVPLGSSAPVVSDGSSIFIRGAAGAMGNLGTTGVSGSAIQLASASASGALNFGAAGTTTTGLEADLSAATGASITDLREAFALQRYQENRARYGSRFTEYLRFLGVRSSDARLQRPEYLGGGKQTIQFSEVLQTGPGTGDEGVGNLAGHGIGAMRSNRYRKYFEEHGYIFSLLTVRPKTMYTQGIARHWQRTIKEDFWQRELQHIGQQEVYAREIYAAATSADAVFGYQDRYDEYRRAESSVAGQFRSSLDYWHMARTFATEPALNADFVEANPTKRVLADQVNDALLVMANHSIQARRLVAPTGKSFIY